MMGVQAFFNDDAHEYLDTARGLSEADKRYVAEQIAKDDTRLANIMAQHYGDTVAQITARLDSVLRTCDAGEENIDADIEAYQNGELSEEEFGNRLAEYSRDLNNLRPVVESAKSSEERAWSEVSVTPGQYQRQVAKRFPALFANGRNLVRLPTLDDD
ncbi:hypothetical protein [Nocardioides sp. TF02-7]|uniref:hypothetical protein n=1 Tax=Nocardioides sp. TF02-7 TaxID=2917724 RepID=UPI001F06CE6F|nr:hypothetical protein [Nocardioides sp. TF02-7]UMG92843.1 hypothetical protein MF408_00135 [Nocardioides sp. TF02-7]